MNLSFISNLLKGKAVSIICTREEFHQPGFYDKLHFITEIWVAPTVPIATAKDLVAFGRGLVPDLKPDYDDMRSSSHSYFDTVTLAYDETVGIFRAEIFLVSKNL